MMPLRGGKASTKMMGRRFHAARPCLEVDSLCRSMPLPRCALRLATGQLSHRQQARQPPLRLMEVSPSLPLLLPLLLPRHGESTRLLVGASELVLESVRGGHSLLWSDGRQARRYSLGLTAQGRLVLQLCAPRLPLRVIARDAIAIVPGGRLSAYLQIPLVPTLHWCTPAGERLRLIELAPADLQAEWDEAAGHCFRVPAALHVRFPMRSGEPKVVIPVRLHNGGATMLSPDFLPLNLRDEELLEKRGSIVVAPRRLQWVGDQFLDPSRAPATSESWQ